MISTHAPRTGSDNAPAGSLSHRFLFQPTLPARGATLKDDEDWHKEEFQPTLPARGATNWMP